MGRDHLAHTIGDAANAILAAVGFNFQRILTWIAILFAIVCDSTKQTPTSNQCSQTA